ncbi:MAG: HEAT repeat domain-containing protein [Acidobacteriota bacterium]|nr:MAG: HEAT repeat domain-containing protein [Acidobacteriota bacterium]
MDLLGFFRGSPERQIQKLRKKVKEPHGDPAPRQNAAQRLFEMGTDESLRALLERFTISVSPSVQDEQEKEQVFYWLVQLGDRAVPAITSFLRNERWVYWPTRALREILSDEDLARKMIELLRFHWEYPPATAIPKAELLRSLGTLSTPELVEVVALFLEDENDDVRLAAAEYLFSRPEEDGRESILNCYLESEDRPRVRLQILERFAETDWTVKGCRPTVEESLPDGFTLTREGKVRRMNR